MTRAQHNSITLVLTVAASAATLVGLSGCRGDRHDETPRQFLQDMASKFFGFDGETGDLGAGPEGGLSGT